MGFVGNILTTVTNLVESTVAANAAKIATAISPVFFAAIAVYVIFIAYEIIYSQKEVVMSEVTKTIMAFTAIGAFTYSAPYYAEYVIPFVMHAGQDLSSALTGNTDTANSIDNLWLSLSSTMDTFITEKSSELNMLDFGGYIDTYAVYYIGYIGGAILIFYTAIFLVVSTLCVGVALSAGIIFICFSAFPATRNMFTSWCGICLNYILLSLFYTISFSFVLSLINAAMVDADSITMFTVATLLLTIIVCVFLIEQVGTICSTLTGGVGINGLISAANGFGGKLAGGMARASGMRSFAKGLSSRFNNPAAAAGSKLGGAINKLAARGNGKNIIGG